MLKHKGTVTLETERILLRKFQLTDAEDMFKNWGSDDEVTKYLSWPTHKSLDTTKALMAHWCNGYSQDNFYQWAIVLKDIDEVIGSVSLMSPNDNLMSSSLGYCVGKAFWGKGLVTELTKEILRFGLEEVNFQRIEARHHLDNPASGRVMEKCGMKYEGTLRNITLNNKGDLVDCKYYSVIK